MKSGRGIVFTSLIVFFCCLHAHAQVTAFQLDQMASKLLSATQINLRGDIVVHSVQSQGFAAIRYQGNFARIFVHPSRMQSESENTWAFVIGHELGHKILRTGGTPQAESAADVVGAKMAVKVGYDAKAFINYLYQHPNSCTRTHGCFHSRARKLESIYGSVGKWNRAHVDHPTATGPAPSRVKAGTRRIKVYCRHSTWCRHRIACGHKMVCQHPFWNGFVWVRAHQFDTQHQFDTRHQFDFKHRFDWLRVGRS